jgi:aldehyde dehydrogenase (NAD+)
MPSRYEEAKAITRAAAEAVVVGDPMTPGVLMGPMCSASQKKTVQDYIQKGLDEGASLIAGGLGAPEGLERGFYVKPTVFADVDNQMSIAREEIFGPVLCLIPYETEQQAIDIANDNDFGLSGAVWSGDSERAVSVARQIRTGQVYINGAEFNTDAPFGGYKQSGNGRELGDAGMHEFIETKAIQMPA